MAGLSLPSPPRNDLWTIPGEEASFERWPAEDATALSGVDQATHHHELQLRDIVAAITEGRRPAVDGAEGRATVELIEAIYRSAMTGQRVT